MSLTHQKGSEHSTAHGGIGGNHIPSTHKQNNNSKNNIGSFSNGSGTSVVHLKTSEDHSKAPHSARSNQSDGVNVHASLPKISNR